MSAQQTTCHECISMLNAQDDDTTAKGLASLRAPHLATADHGGSRATRHCGLRSGSRGATHPVTVASSGLVHVSCQ